MPFPVPSYSEIMALLKKGATIEAQEKIMALREAVLTLEEENLALRNELKALKESSNLADLMHFNGKIYVIDSDPKKNGQYCPACFDKDRKAIRLYSVPTAGIWICHVCDARYEMR
jgi:hypothetical protein